jgi:anthranilate/para-aminobenzoate synthase component II
MSGTKLKVLLYANVYETTVGQSITYMDFFSRVGDVILVTSEMDLEKWVKEGDVLALPGGADVLSSTYKSSPGFFAGKANPHYEYLDKVLLSSWLKTGKPIIGICRGLQVLNVACGGTLHTHVRGHIQNDDKYYRHDRPEEMYLADGILEAKHNIYPINSFHHQAIKRLADGFEVLGWSEYEWNDRAALSTGNYQNYSYTKDKQKAFDVKSKELEPMIPELIRHTTKPYIAFQYHPEEFDCLLAITLIKRLLAQYETDKKTSGKIEVAS